MLFCISVDTRALRVEEVQPMLGWIESLENNSNDILLVELQQNKTVPFLKFLLPSGLHLIDDIPDNPYEQTGRAATVLQELDQPRK